MAFCFGWPCSYLILSSLHLRFPVYAEDNNRTHEKCMLGGIERPPYYTQSAGNSSSKACDFNYWVTISRGGNFCTCARGALHPSSALYLTLGMVSLKLAEQCTTQQHGHPCLEGALYFLPPLETSRAMEKAGFGVR